MKPDLNYPALIANHWFHDMIKDLIKTHGSDVEKIMDVLTEKFPYYYSNPPKQMSMDILRLRAATQVILHRPNLVGKTRDIARYVKVIEKRFPRTADLYKSSVTTDSVYSDIIQKLKEADLSGGKPCINCGKFHDDLGNDIKNYSALSPEELRALIKIIDFPQYVPLRPKLEKAITTYLGAITQNSKFLYNEYEEVKDLAQYVKYPAHISALNNMKKINFGYTWEETILALEKTYLKGSNERWKCPNCFDFHLDKPPKYKGVTFDIHIPYLEKMIELASDNNRDYTTDPELRKIFEPIFEFYGRAVNLGVPGLVSEAGAKKYENMKRLFSSPSRFCIKFYK